jgi:BNR/Asp-box repeat protein
MFRCGPFIPLGPLAAVVLVTCLSGCNSDNSSYQLGGKVSGLVTSHEVTLLNNGGDATTVSANGSFMFPAGVSAYTRYNVTIGTQPSDQICVVAPATASGTATADVTGISVSCDYWVRTDAPAVNPSAIAISGDASHMAVTELGGGILTSADHGATWTRTPAIAGAWVAITSSADGARLAAAMSPGSIYVSSDAGASWKASNAPTASWTSLAFSGDGTQVVAVSADYVVSGGQAINYVGTIYLSVDAGLTWSQSNGPCCNWAQIAASSDGTHLAAVSTGGSPAGVSPPVFSPNGVYTSINAGVTWVLQTGAESPPVTAPASACTGLCVWNSIASSTDGLTLVASRNNQLNGSAVFGSITVTHDGGTSWVLAGAPTNFNWRAVTSSGDGKRLAAAGADGVYVSTDGGTTWNKTSAPQTISTVVSTSDGTHLVAIDNGQAIWIAASF